MRSHLGKLLWTGFPLAVLQRETRQGKPSKPQVLRIHPPFILFNDGGHGTGMHNPSSVRQDFCLDRLAVSDGKERQEEAASAAAPGLLRLASESSSCSTIV